MAIEQVEPARCTLWQFHERVGDELTGESCKELITSIQRHGQRHPALGRRLARTHGATVELIYGGRRLFAAAQLGIQLLVDLRELNDREAIVEMEIENRLRTDISPYERGMSYRRWLNAGLFTSQSELAKELGASEAQISRLLRYADLPAAVVGAFDCVQSIREEWAVALAKICQDPGRRPKILRRAREVSQGEQRYPPQVVFRRLVAEAHLAGSEPVQRHDEIVKSQLGRPMYRVAVRAKTVHFIVPRDGLSEYLLQELKHQLTSTLGSVVEGSAAGRLSYTDRRKHSTSYEPAAGGA
ncbi:MAG TPA: ParB/RepB/Spo0J family partition protein [Steroidobacteraceae bacterium]|nr:ParB/RepB/Spo0J family partition protein [Steroidobacteraceae bacterium]